MNRSSSLFFRVFLVILITLNLAGLYHVPGQGEINSTDEFIEKLEEEYRGIEDFSARLTISGLDPPLQVELLAVSEPRTLRVEYLSPPEMKDQFFLLEGDFLYQFMPAQNLIIKKDLKDSDMPVRAANLTPDYLLEMVRSDELEVNLTGAPSGVVFPWKEGKSLEFQISISELEEKYSFNSFSSPDSTCPVSFGSGGGNYVLEVVPRKEGYQFARQVIKFDPDTFLPRELITYFEEKNKEPVLTEVDEVETNLGLDRDRITKLPKDAEIISD